jgi:succinyl-diaminopimelate desuccinylase
VSGPGRPAVGPSPRLEDPAGRSALGAALMDVTAELVDIPSVSHHETAIADRVERTLNACERLSVVRVGDNVVARTTSGHERRLVVAGHLDTVPPAGNAAARREGDELWGIGAADMKGSLAVMLRLATQPPPPAMDVTWCFYACEEVGRERSGLRLLWQSEPELLAGDAAVLCEPTEGLVEAGCQGTMRAHVTLTGRRAHTARPFTGRNAIHRLGAVVQRVASWPVRRVMIQGCEYAEQMQAVSVEGGVAGNVVPDKATLTLNYRFAPDRDADGARRVVEDLVGDLLEPEIGDRIEVVDLAEGAPPALDQPLLQRLVQLSGEPPRAKVGWTDVATFWSHGVPAANFGAGDPLLAHHPDERVEETNLVRVHETLSELLSN